METAMVMGQGTGRCRNFPCCCDVPLEMAVQFMVAFDTFYSTSCLIGWVTLFGLDIFASRKVPVHNGTSDKGGFIAPSIGTGRSTKPPDYKGKTTSTTTERLPFTIRPTTTQPPFYDYDISDTSRLSQTYSKIAVVTKKRHDYIEQKCGREYIINYLFTYELVKTREMFTEFLWAVIAAEITNVILSVFMLSTLCCFIEHKGSKVMVMCLWWSQWIPMLLSVNAAILSQSRRLCVLEYAWAHRGFRGQTFLLWIEIWPYLGYKQYEFVLVGCYIRELLKAGFLKDESLPPVQGQGESDFQRKYYKEFREIEAQKGREIHEENGVTEVTEGYDDMDAIEVDKLRESVGGHVDRNEWYKRKQAAVSSNIDPRIQLKSQRKQ